MILEKIESRDDLLRLNAEERRALCAEIRAFLVEHVSRTGGHLASNLGIVETAVAIETVFDTKKDRLVFDVGHQSYVHKILTGRREAFDSLRQYGGLSGFPNPEESDADAFIAGHASNAVSVALGMAKARTLRGEDYQVAALVGDGALTGGLAYEGLNNAGISREPMVVILNDNGMSITPNVGAISRYLAKARLRPRYIGFKLWYRRVMEKNAVGRGIYTLTHRAKERLRRGMLGTTLFETLGFTYLGPVDGHDVEKVIEILHVAAALREPVLVHLITQKGRGYIPAEEKPRSFHGVGKFDPESGRALKQSGESFSDVFGRELTALAREDARICAITAAMEYGTGLNHFAKAFPERFFDVGIAEGHAVSMAAGLAKQGMTPVFAVYSTFLQRSFDMLLHDVAIAGVHVVFAVDRAGLAGEDGQTHHGMFDVGYLRMVPGMRVYCPANFAELREMLREAVEDTSGPAAVRYPRGGEANGTLPETGKTRIQEGWDCTLVCYGTMAYAAMHAARRAEKNGIHVEVLKLATVAPLDMAAVCESVKKTGKLLVVEEVSGRGCVAEEIFARLGAEGVAFEGAARNLGDGFVTHGSAAALLREQGLDADGILRGIEEVCGHEA